MITKNPMQLKALIKKKAAENHISAQMVMQNYMLERLLERVSVSPYRRNLILKGGFLISSLVGLDTRATMDLDTTLQGIALTHESAMALFGEICKTELADDVFFVVEGSADIREGDVYPGIRIHLKANYPPICVPLTVDITTGDRITPKEMEYLYPLMFDQRGIPIMAYNVETILAEKLETVLSRGEANTRPRDFYDIYILWQLQTAICSKEMLKKALEETSKKRGSYFLLSKYRQILSAISNSAQLQQFWQKYQSDFIYASGISFQQICQTIEEIMGKIEAFPIDTYPH